jgi:ATP-dependent helicase HrpA
VSSTSRREERWEQLCRSISFPPQLPVSRRAEDITQTIKDHPVVIIAGETGSGKTTQVPKCALLAGLGKNGRLMVTQPRRLAATRTALRIAEELKVEIGDEVGYRIRFQHKSSQDSLLEVVTDGIPLSGDLSARPFDGFDGVIVDEVHERSVNIDLLLGLLKGEREHNPDFRVLLMSATLNTERYRSFFPEAQVLEVEGRTFPVEIEYRQRPRGQQLPDHLAATLGEALGRSRGDVLCFLPTERDIRECERKLQGRFGNAVDCLPLFSRLSQKEQDQVFKSGSGRQRVILATNIAETSITLPKVTCVIDSGLVRLLRFQPGRGVPLLEVESISKASARQRCGRAGRTSSGFCLRLYSEKDYQNMEDFTLPEIQRQDLAQVILKLVSMGVKQPEDFPFPDRPSSKAMKSGQRQLEFLGAVVDQDDGLELTAVGRQMAKQPLSPRLAHLMLKAKAGRMLDEAAVISAFLSMQDPRQNPADQLSEARGCHRRLQVDGSDLLTVLKLYGLYRREVELRSNTSLRKWCNEHFLSWRRMKEWEQLCGDLQRTIAPRHRFGEIGDIDEVKLHRLVLGSHLDHLLELDDKAEDGSYHSLGRRSIFIHPSSAMAKSGSRWGACTSFLNTSRLFSLQNFVIEPSWICELAPKLIRIERGEARYDSKTKKVVSSETHRFRGHVVKTIANKDHFPWDQDEASEVFCREAIVRGELEWPALEPFRLLKQQLDNFDAAMRVRESCSHEDRLVDAWKQQLGPCSRLSDLRKLKAEKLNMSIDALLDPGEREHWGKDLPMAINIAEESCECRYLYGPGREDDGVTVVLTTTALASLRQRELELAIPLWAEERLRLAHETLPKVFKRQFSAAQCLAQWDERWQAQPELSLKQTLERWMALHTAMESVSAQWLKDWESKCSPHLTPQLALLGKSGELEQRGRDVKTCQGHNFSAMERKHLNDLKRSQRRNLGSASENTLKTLGTAMACLVETMEQGQEQLDLRGQSFLTYPRVYLQRDQCWVEPEPQKSQARRESLISLGRLHGRLSEGEPDVATELLARLSKVVPDLHQVKNDCTQSAWELLWLRMRPDDLKDLNSLRARLKKCENKYWQRDLHRLLNFCESCGELRRNSKKLHPQSSQENWLFRQCAKASFHGRFDPQQWVHRDLEQLQQRIVFLGALLEQQGKAGSNFDQLCLGWRQLLKTWGELQPHPFNAAKASESWQDDLFPAGFSSASSGTLADSQKRLQQRQTDIEALERRFKAAQQWLLDAEDDLEAEVQAKARNRKRELLDELKALEQKREPGPSWAAEFCEASDTMRNAWSKLRGQKKRVLEEEKSVGAGKLKDALLTAWGSQKPTQNTRSLKKTPSKARR